MSTPAPAAAALPASPAVSLPASPAAQRLGSPRWRDGRLLAGIVLLLASVAVGARLLTTDGSRVQMLSARATLSAGHVLTDGDLATVSVALGAGQGGDYLRSADRPTVVGKTLTRPLSAGELLPVAAVVTDPASATAEVSLSVRDGRHPALDAGDRVDVYATTEAPAMHAASAPASATSSASATSPASAALANATAVCTTVPVAVGLEVVSAVPTDADGAAATVILRVPPAQAAALVHASEAGDIDLVRDPRVTASGAAGATTAAGAAGAAEPTAAPLQAIGPVTAGACATGK